MRQLHHLNAYLLIGLNALAGLVALGYYLRKRAPDRALWILIGVAQATVFVQAVIGAALTREPGVKLNDMHALYGFSAIITVMIVYSYRKSESLRDKELLLYGFGSLFIMGLGLRELVLV